MFARCGCWSIRWRTVTTYSGWSTACGRISPRSSTTTSPPPRRTTTSRSTPRWSDPAARPWRCRSAPGRWTSTPSSASPPTGATRRAVVTTRVSSRRSPGCANCSTGRRKRPMPVTLSIASSPRYSRTGSTS
uniref:Uncharacterized protein n=1 Tax=uncultured bacterium 9F08 TaxID=697051 RepID=D2XIR9_9BACT|nr:hypothetical protein [uncultured bacterium 9F08]